MESKTSFSVKLSGSGIEVREICAAEEIKAAQYLRFQVWDAEGALIRNPNLGLIADSHDEHALHWGAFHGSQMIGAARFCIHDVLVDAPDGALFCGIDLPVPVANLNRMVVLRSFRDKGVGGVLDHMRIVKASLLGAQAIIASPVQSSARQLALENRGFTFLSGVTSQISWCT
jgi:hypothetical protein